MIVSLKEYIGNSIIEMWPNVSILYKLQNMN